MRAVFYDEDDAIAAAGRLRKDGWDVSLTRDRFAGEDDDEDHPWAVLTDAPAIVLELLVEQYDGWLDEDDGAAPDPSSRPVLPPVELPTAPKRIKRL